MIMEKTAFRLKSYRFVKASINFEIPPQPELEISFNPRGTYYQNKGLYELHFDVTITCKETKSKVVSISCESEFEFNTLLTIDKIPEFFYPNSLAILFPYIRAFISTISLQANVTPILLPTINLIGLTSTLRDNTVIK